jgi:hypothetical protein
MKQPKRTPRLAARQSLPIVGVALTDTELEKIPREQKFPFSKPKPKGRVFVGRVKDLLIGGADETGAPPRPYQCPIGHEDVTGSVISACSMGPARYVAVQCVNKHWARYPCRT